MKLKGFPQTLGGALALLEIRQPAIERGLRPPATGPIFFGCVVEVVHRLGADDRQRMRQQHVDQRAWRKFSAIVLAQNKRRALAKERGDSSFLGKQAVDALALPQDPRHLRGHSQCAPAIRQGHGGHGMQLVEHSLDGIVGASTEELACRNEEELLAKLRVIDIDLSTPEHCTDRFRGACIVNIEDALPFLQTGTNKRNHDGLVILLIVVDEAAVVAGAQIIYRAQSARTFPSSCHRSKPPIGHSVTIWHEQKLGRCRLA